MKHCRTTKNRPRSNQRSRSSSRRQQNKKIPPILRMRKSKISKDQMSEHWPMQRKGGANRHSRLTMQTTRPSLADAIRILDRLSDPAASKCGGQSSHRRAITPESDRGMVTIVGGKRAILREYHRLFQGGLGRPKLGPSR